MLWNKPLVDATIALVSPAYNSIKNIPTEREIAIIELESQQDIIDISRSVAIFFILFFTIPPSMHFELITIIAFINIPPFCRLAENSKIPTPSGEDLEFRRNMIEKHIVPSIKYMFDSILSNSMHWNYNDTLVYHTFLEIDDTFKKQGLWKCIQETKERYKYISAWIDPIVVEEKSKKRNKSGGK